MKVCFRFLFPAALALMGFINRAGAVGAVTPFTSYEGEAGFIGGGATVVSMTVAPTNQYASAVIEASGRAFVQLTNTGAFVQWTNTTGTNINGINLRSCIPDAPAGGGITNTIDLYVNGVFRQSFAVNSEQNYCYEGTNYDGQTDKNPADGDPRGFWNDTHALVSGTLIAPGDTFSFQEDATNTASFYDIDVVDIEYVPPPLAQPAGSLCITNSPYNAVPNNLAVDNTTAINNCFKAARSTGSKTVYIPPGMFCVNADSGGLNASGITIVGAGPWYSTLYRVTPANNTQIVANILTTVSCTVSNLSLDCNANSRAGDNNDGAIDCSGTNWVVDNIWMQHTTSSFWCAGVNGIARNSRTLSTWADGGNFNNFQSGDGIGNNLTYSNNFVRGTGDDAMAINSGPTYNMQNTVYANNTAICPWGGKCMGLYGGSNDIVINNLCIDTPRYLGLGVMRFGVGGGDLISAVVSNNVLIRCGGNGYNQQQQAMMIGNGGDGQGVGTVENAYVVSNTIIDSIYDAVGLSTGTNIVFEDNTIISPGLDGVAIGAPDLGSGVTGFAVFNNNTLTGLNHGRSGFVNSAAGYVGGGIGNVGFTVPSPVPTPWLSQDIGAVGVTGGASYSKQTFTVVGSGANIGGTTDAFHYVYEPASGNSLLLARVATEELINPSKAGVMIRNSLDPADLNAAVLVTPNNGVVFQWRSTYGGATSSASVPGVSAPCWVQLARGDSNTFTASYSTDGANWTNLSSPTAVNMGTSVYIGMAVTSGANGALCSAMIDDVSSSAPAAPYLAVHWEGNLIMNLQSADLSLGSKTWTNRTSDANSVGNFTAENHGNLAVASMLWSNQNVNALYVNKSLNFAVQSAVSVPAEVISNNPVSVEAWIYANAVTQQNSCAVGYGIQGGSSDQQADREFNYSSPCCGGGVSGDFGSYDTQWAITPAPGAWHYLAWTWDGATVLLYLDGMLNTSNTPSSPLQTPATVVGVGAGLTSGPNLGADPFEGYIAVARLESGVLTANDIATNFSLGLLATAAALTPGGLAANAGDGQVVLTWDSPGNATSYTLVSSTNNGGPYSVLASGLTGNSYTNAGLADGTTYYYEVSASNSAGASTNSDQVSAEPIAGPPTGVRWEGDLLVNLQSSDLNAASPVWTNRTSNPNAVGNFTSQGGGNLAVATLTWNTQAVNVLAVGQTISSAVESALTVPSEIISNSPVSAEAWIYATNVTEQNSCAIAYGIQGGPSDQEADREFNYSTPCCGGGVSGDFGSYDTQWATTPAPGAWHYLAWSYDGTTVRLYLDGQWNASNTPGSPLQTPATIVGVGAGVANGGPGLGADAFQGYIAAARLESGVLTTNDIATNYSLGLLAITGQSSVSATLPLLSYAVNGGQALLSWPQDHTGWFLQAQTNSPGAGLGTNWVTIPASQTTNEISLPLAPTNGSVFYRLTYP